MPLDCHETVHNFLKLNFKNFLIEDIFHRAFKSIHNSFENDIFKGNNTILDQEDSLLKTLEYCLLILLMLLDDISLRDVDIDTDLLLRRDIL